MSPLVTIMTPLCSLVDSAYPQVPGSKSIINRLLTLALYHDIELHLQNINLCDDVRDMLGVYEAIGKPYKISGTELIVYRGFTMLKVETVNITISGSGTCLRFVMPFLALVYEKKCHITMGERLANRPIQPLINCLVRAGADICVTGNKIEINMNSLPKTKTKKPVDSLHLGSNISSQFFSAILLYCSFFKDTEIIGGGGTAPSLSYIRMTSEVIRMLPDPSITPSTLSVKLDPDYSTVCYIWLYSYLCKKEIFIQETPTIYHPDYYFMLVLWNLGIIFTQKNGTTSVSLQSPFPCPHSEITVNMKRMPDQIITLAFLCLVAGVKAQISGCANLAHKESNRIVGIIENVHLLGGKAEYTDDTLTIEPLSDQPTPCTLKTYHDHRFACVFWVLQQKYPFLEIDDVQCASKSI